MWPRSISISPTRTRAGRGTARHGCEATICGRRADAACPPADPPRSIGAVHFFPRPRVHRRGPAPTDDLERDFDHAVCAVQGCAHVGRPELQSARRFQDVDRPPGTHGMDRRLPADHVAQQGRAHVPQGVVRDQCGPPARPALAAGQFGIERAEGDEEFVLSLEIDLDFLSEEHVVRNQDRPAVQPDLGEGREAVEAKHPAAAPGEVRTIPDVLFVQRRRFRLDPAAGRAQRLRRCAGHGRTDPVERVRKLIGSGRRPRRGAGQSPFRAQGPVTSHPLNRSSRVSKTVS